jgi:uncharacterized protein (TIGR00725 family)
MNRTPVIAVVGSGSEIEPAVSNARKLGRLVAENGWILINGGRDTGVMRAANEGAKEIEGSLTIGVLPDRKSHISSAVDVAIVTETGQARTNTIVLSADVVIACGVDGAGTASEVSLAIKNGKPVILLAASEEAKKFFKPIGGNYVYFADSPNEAISRAKQLFPREAIIKLNVRFCGQMAETRPVGRVSLRAHISS